VLLHHTTPPAQALPAHPSFTAMMLDDASQQQDPLHNHNVPSGATVVPPAGLSKQQRMPLQQIQPQPQLMLPATHTSGITLGAP
jgi:hypothetical protein